MAATAKVDPTPTSVIPVAMACVGAKTAGQGELVWSGRMSTRGVDFLEQWIQKNVTAGAPPDDPLSASVLATRCIATAAAEGLALEEIKPD